MPLQLITPAMEQAFQHKPELRAAVLVEWLDGLRDQKPSESAPQVLAALAGLNRSELADEARHKLAMLYQPNVNSLIRALIETLPENGTPQTQDHRQAASLVQELGLEMTYAWKLVYQGIERRRFAFASGKARHNTLGYLLVAQANLINSHFRIYTVPPEHSWHELHQVFHTLFRLDSAEALDSQPTAYGVAYKRTMLLALADPFRFTRAEMDATLVYLSQYHAFARITEARKPGMNQFQIDTGADFPCAQTFEPDVANELSLDTHKLDKHLRRLARRLNAGESTEKLGLPPAFKQVQTLLLIERLRKNWCGNKQRGFKRYQPGELSFLEVVCGMDNLHQLFSKPEPPPVNQHPPVAQWRVLNDSASGMSIAALARDVPQIRLGDPVALRSFGSASWTLGVIRWGKIAKGQIVEAGIERLAPSASAAVIRVFSGSHGKLAEPILLVPANAALQTSERLLLPKGLYTADRSEAEIWHNGQHRKIILRGLVEQSPVFDLVEFIAFS